MTQYTRILHVGNVQTVIVTRYWKTDQDIMHEINRISKFKHLTLLKYFQSLYSN